MGAAVLALAGAAVSAVGTFVQMRSAQNAAAVQEEMAEREFEEAQRVASQNYYRQMDELSRQQRETNRATEERKSDITRRLEAERATARVQLAEIGALGTISGESIVRDMEGVAATDLSRVESARRDNLESIEQNRMYAGIDRRNNQRKSGLQLAMSQADARLQRQTAATNAFFGMINTGLGAFTQYRANQQKLNPTSGALA